MAAPLKHPPSFAAEKVTAAAADGFSKRGVASMLGVSFETMERWFVDHPDLKEAFEQGREMERRTLHNVLYRLATEEKDKIAAMFLLKARHGYREGDQGDQGGRAIININLPGSMPLDKFVTVENNNESDNRTERLSNALAKPSRRA